MILQQNYGKVISQRLKEVGNKLSKDFEVYRLVLNARSEFAALVIPGVLGSGIKDD